MFFEQACLPVMYIYVHSVCIWIVSFPLSNSNKSSPTLLQVLQTLGKRFVKCEIHYEQDVSEEQHPYM